MRNGEWMAALVIESGRFSALSVYTDLEHLVN
jgi:hypothetical protein